MNNLTSVQSVDLQPELMVMNVKYYGYECKMVCCFVYISQYKNVILYARSTFYGGFILHAVSLNRVTWQGGTNHKEVTSSAIFRTNGKDMFLPNLPTYWILTFRVPCIVIYSYNKPNEMRWFLRFIYGIELYMFRTVSLSIIRSLALYTQQ